MEIREKQSLFSLFAASFSVANRAGMALAVSIISMLLILAIPLAIVVFFSLRTNVPQFLYLIFAFFALFCFVWLQMACLRIIAAKAEKNNESVPEAFTNTVVPTVYAFIYQLIINITFGVAGVLANLIPILGPLCCMLASIYFGIRLMFGPFSIALREQGPISAITYSWQLTSGRFFYLLGAGLLAAVIPMLLAGLIAYGVIVGIPLYFADSFSLANLSMGWIITFAVLGFFYLLCCLAMFIFIVLVFLNLDYGYNRDTFTPVEQEQLNQQTPQVFGPENNVLPPGAGNTVTVKDVPQVQVLQASVRTDPDNSELHQHLEKVYQPKPEDIVEYTEEDRMPTILFDDDMAKQLEEQRAAWQAKKNEHPHQKGDDDISSIKMSK